MLVQIFYFTLFITCLFILLSVFQTAKYFTFEKVQFVIFFYDFYFL